MSKTIQIDAFEVQLGAGVLLQFSVDGECVRVLADAGVHASGYDEDHVHLRLNEAFASFSDDKRFLNLIIGTHYDKDHLAGLVPIIEDESIEIGEAWLPPVANDTRSSALSDVPTETDFLSTQFAEEEGRAHLISYLTAKAITCTRLARIEQRASEFRTLHSDFANEPRLFSTLTEIPDFRGDDFLSTAEHFFSGHRNQASALCGGDSTHCAHDINTPADIESLAGDLWPHYGRLGRHLGESLELLGEMWNNEPEVANSNRLSLASIRQGAANEAINATSLYRVVKALKDRRIPIRNYWIPDGTPRRFVWQPGDPGRFIPRARGGSRDLELQLLGPSQSLIKKHWHRLPLGDYMSFALSSRVPVKGITPSNQLSYVLRFDCEAQKMLITGDAGCVDFMSTPRGQYYPDLLAGVGELHFIQVAHHGGNNAHFYNVLLASAFPEQTETAYLLLSHATEDVHRPSAVFDMFIAQARTPGDDFWLLFTSQPNTHKVSNYLALIHPLVGRRSDRGDVCLVFDTGWKVTKHAIQI